jgi:hypothetical protein
MLLLKSLQRKDFPLHLYCHSVQQLLSHVVQLFNQHATAGGITRLVKVRAHRGEPLNEAADALARTSAAAESDPSNPVAIEFDPEAVHFMWRQAWFE